MTRREKRAFKQRYYGSNDGWNLEIAYHEILHEKSFSGNFERFFDEDKLKTLPAGFPKDFKDAELLKLKHYIVESKLTNDILAAPDVVDRLAAVFRNGYPLNRFLNYTVDEVIWNCRKWLRIS